MPVPVTMTVSQVRQALFHAAGGQSAAGPGLPSTAQLGRWFHDGIGQLVQTDNAASSPLRSLLDLDENLDVWKQHLVETAYHRVVGPQLTQAQANLQECGPQVRAYWQAMQAACQWLAELSWELRPRRAAERGRIAPPWETLANLMTTEEPLRCQLHEPGWSAPVELVGLADAVVRLKKTGAWCAIEFKLGQTVPEVDLGQACLYHLLLSPLSGQSESGESAALAVVSFLPERKEHLFSGPELVEARARLLNLIGHLAGVLNDSPNGTPSRSVNALHVNEAATAPSRSANFTTVPTAEHRALGDGLVRTFAEYGIPVSIQEPVVAGPTFLRFPIHLGPKAKVAAAKKLVPELQLRLKLRAEPFVQMEQGQLVVDVQRPDRQTITFDQVRDQLNGHSDKAGSSLVPIGIDLSGTLQRADLSRPEHAHLLVVGTTGSGKSEWLRLAVAGLIAANTPDTLRFLVIDPKRNAFHALQQSPYLWKPLVFPDEQDAAQVLMELAEEMDRRYRLFNGADSFTDVVSRENVILPRIVCLCDEYRDLISRDKTQRQAIEDQICRLGSKARAAGIHLIIATQEARRETIKGALDSNMPARVGLKMGKALESRLLFGENGSERLLGNGDLLFKDVGDLRRLQAPLLSESNRQEFFGAGRNG